MKTHFAIDEQIEIAKRRLRRSPSFNIHDAWACCDSFRQGRLTKDDLRRLMARNGFNPSEGELLLLNCRFDRNSNGFIMYQEFMDEILCRPSLLGCVQHINSVRQTAKGV